nr:penicillin acylase family protein [Candidatus Sigynarchaeota archaeon]
MDIDEMLRIAKSAFPPDEGTTVLRGLNDDVEVCWDTWGIPHVYATSAVDAWFIQGYIHAQHRLFQMEMMRRKYRGRLA